MIKAGIIGATGYAGSELVRILMQHPQVEIKTMTAHSYVGRPYDEVYENYRQINEMVCEDLDIEKMAKERSGKIVSAASDTINLARPFEIKTRKPGDLGGETKTISHKLHTKLMNLAEELHCNYEDLITVMNFESGMNPKEGAGKKNKAVGLIQFTNNAIKELNKNYSLNLTKDKITAMNAEEQIDIVGKYLKMCISRASRLRNKTKLDAADLYSVIILPGRAGSDILCRKGEKNANGKLLRYYESNAGIDVGKDGIITRADVLAKLDDFRVNVKVV